METEQIQQSLIVKWFAPPGWATPPKGFRLDGRWRPDPYWPSKPFNWQFWQVEGPLGLVAAYNGELTPPDSDPKLEWVSAPGWPTPPRGFAPTEYWRPDPTWPAAPADWVFWHQPERDVGRDLRVEVAARADRLRNLNHWEQRLYVCAGNVASAENDDSLFAHLPKRRQRQRACSQRLSVLERWREVCLVLRDHLLYCVSHDVEPSQDYFLWRREAVTREQELTAGLDTLADAPQRRRLQAELRSTADALMAQLEKVRDASEAAGDGGSDLVGKPWQLAEALAAAALRHLGFHDAQVTGAGADGGIDVRGTGVVAQVKNTAAPVGRPVLQRLVGAANGVPSICFSASGYSTHALEYANERSMPLFVLELPSSIRAVNEPAAQLTRLTGAEQTEA